MTKKIGEIDYDLRLPKRSLFLCRPNGQTIAKINDYYDLQHNEKTNSVNDISFKIPTFLDRDGVLVVNPNIERIRNRYLFKLKIDAITETFIIDEHNKVYSDETYTEYHAYSLPFQLGDKNIRAYNMIGNLRQVGDGILDEIYGKKSEVNIKRWEVGYVDDYFILSTIAERDIEIASMSGLEAMMDLANKWGAIIDFDTENLKINYYAPENYGVNRGLSLTVGNLMEGFDLNISASNTVTRLRAFGSNNLTFSRISPTGQDYIEDFSLYMYPFEYDKATGEVLKSSEHLTDELCIAITKYNDFIESMQSVFETILAKIETTQEILTTESQTLSKITIERILLEDERDLLLSEYQPDRYQWGNGIWNASGNKDGTSAHADVLARLGAKREQERLQQTVVSNIEFQLADFEREKREHLEKLSPTRHYSLAEWEELQPFIITKEYSNDSITNELDLLNEAKTVFAQMREPKLILSVNMIDVMQAIECQNNWGKLNKGDDIRVKHEDLRVDVMAKIIEVNRDYEGFNVNLVIANERDSKEKSKTLDILSSADLTSSIVSLDRDGWNLGKEANGKVNDIINSKWDANKQAVLAGYDQLVEISERGIIIRSPEDPLSWLVIQNGMLAITNDGGNSWKQSINKDGIFGEYVFGKLISGVNLYIEDESGIWKTQGSRTTIYDRNGTERMRLGLVSDNEKDGLGNIIPQLNECFGLSSWNDSTKVEITDCVGMAISKWKDGDWEKVLWANTDGTLFSKDMVAERIKIVNNVGDVILDAENNYFNIGILTNIVADGKITTLEKLNLVTELYKVHADYKNVLEQAEKYNKSSRDITYNMSAQWSQTGGFPVESIDNIDHCDTTALTRAYTDLVNYMSQYLPIVNKGINVGQSLVIDINAKDSSGNIIIERTDVVTDRGKFVQVFRDYDDESGRLKRKIEDSLFYSGINMGSYYNNIMIGEQGFVAVRSDGKYRAYLNATNGLALEKWEGGSWVKKLYASLGDPMWEDGTLIAEGLVTKNLRIVDANMNDTIIFDWYDGITIFGDSANIYLNANDAIRITDKSGDSKFWVDTDGSLFAKDITTHNLKIVNGELGEKIIFDENDGITINGNNKEQIRLNANEGIAIDVDGESRFWVGTDGLLYARKLIIMAGDIDQDILETLGEDGSYISDLMVTKLRTYDKNDPNNYLLAQKKALELKTGDKVKYKLTFDGEGVSANPSVTWGEGSGAGVGKNVAKQYKTPQGFFTEYVDEQGEKHSINLNTDVNKSIEIISPRTILIAGGKGSIKMNNSLLEIVFGSNKMTLTDAGIKINGTRVDIN